MIINDRRTLSQFAALSMAVDNPYIAKVAARKLRSFRGFRDVIPSSGGIEASYEPVAADTSVADALTNARANPGTIVATPDGTSIGYDAAGNIYVVAENGQAYRTEDGHRYTLKGSGAVWEVDEDGDEIGMVDNVALSNKARAKASKKMLIAAIGAVTVAGFVFMKKGRR